MTGIDPLIKPKSLVVIGASSNESSYASRPLKYLLDAGYEGDLAVVHPKRAETLGVATYPSVDDIPFVPDVALVLVGASLVPSVLRECASAGVRFAICVASGFGEAGNTHLDREIREICDGSGLRLLGPNCIGLVNNSDGIPLTFSTVLSQMTLPTGSISIVAQSGALANALLQKCARRGLGVSVAVTTGNELDLEWSEIAATLLEHEETEVILGYVEAFKSMTSARALAKRASELGKAIIVAKSGRTASGAEASRSHTGKIGGDGRYWEAVARQLGWISVDSLDELVDVAEVALATRRAREAGRS